MRDFSAIFAMSPINAAAARVVRFGASAEPPVLTRLERYAILVRLERKHRLLKLALGIRTNAQHKNVMHRHAQGIRQFRQSKEPRIFAEYVRVGSEIQRFSRAIAEERAARRSAAA